MQKILVSACLVGDKVNYKGEGNYCPDIEKLKEKYELVLFCPECEGGLPTPRLPNEIRGSYVVRSDGKDVTNQFNAGASKALMLCKYLGITKAVLKENSPSCGTHKIHDGNFHGFKVNGMGITARFLKKHGIEVFSEDEIEKLL
ncbi:MAG: DUF523 domain-containing protein [Bacilli bacterium]|nr:DUF523 domain-containing protein [Bacilli bacterium]